MACFLAIYEFTSPRFLVRPGVSQKLFFTPKMGGTRQNRAQLLQKHGFRKFVNRRKQTHRNAGYPPANRMRHFYRSVFYDLRIYEPKAPLSFEFLCTGLAHQQASRPGMTALCRAGWQTAGYFRSARNDRARSSRGRSATRENSRQPRESHRST